MSRRAKRKRKTKGAASPRLALYPQPPLVRLDDPSANEETEPDSSLRLVEADKRLQEPCYLLRSQTDPLISHTTAHIRSGFPHGDPDLPHQLST
jgi:hypothetical protein